METLDRKLRDVLAGQEANYLLPFYWQHGDHHDRIPAQIARIASTGCRALCVESRTHPDFCGEGYWRDMDSILSECEARGMQVWLLDDKAFPTGYANGLLTAKYPERRKWMLVERHVDVVGPMTGASVLMTPSTEEQPLLGVYAFRRSGEEECLTGPPIPLTHMAKGGYLYWDIPVGAYRLFFLYQSRQGGRPEYIDMISASSVDVLIEAVYESHYARYARYFGNTFAGFFSDEPEFGNTLVGQSRVIPGFYDMYIGRDGLALPYNQRLLDMMSQELGENATPYLAELWYESAHSPKTRLAYMNAATRLYRDCFSRKLGEWCRAHGVQYIGHVIEDMNAHTRLGHGTGHYFRAMDGQDMGGVDIVLHQVLPGFAHYGNSAIASGGYVDAEFFHYVLPKLASSVAHQVPRMHGRAMCEVFGAYGWGEGTPMMKWLIDFLLVRGVNHFVPHAFSPSYPDPDCPPHFGAEGHDPQLDGFSALMSYTNRMAHLLTGGRHIASVALLYHAEGEWMNHWGEAMLTQKPARVLYDAHLDFDIVCADSLVEPDLPQLVKDHRLCLCEETFAALVVPYAAHLPEALLARLQQLSAAGVNVLYVDGLPLGLPTGEVVPLEALADTLHARGISDIRVQGDYPLLRHYHVEREEQHVIMLCNESPDTTVHTTVRLPMTGPLLRLRLCEDMGAVDHTTDAGDVAVFLLPGQSELILSGPQTLSGLPTWLHMCAPQVMNPAPSAPDHAVAEGAAGTVHTLTPCYTVEIADSQDLSAYRPYAVTDQLFSLTAPDRCPDFAGKVRYTFSVWLDQLPVGPVMLHLGTVGETARVTVNGLDCGIRICAPYDFRVEDSLRAGENQITVEVATTLVRRERDPFSFYLQIPPCGMLGPVTMQYMPADQEHRAYYTEK